MRASLGEKAPQDSTELVTMMHKYGLNMRYLGKVLSHFRKTCDKEKCQSDNFESLLEKEILQRAVKHYIGKQLALLPSCASGG